MHYNFKSGNRTQTTVVALDSNPDPVATSLSTLSFDQVWNELSNSEAWTYDEYFEYDEASPLTYKMSFDSGVPITSHVMEFETLSIGGLEWDPDAGEDWDDDGFPDGDYVDETYSFDDVDTTKFDLWSELVTYSATTENPSGSYNTNQTLAFDWDFVTDYVEFRVNDTQTYDSSGQ